MKHQLFMIHLGYMEDQSLAQLPLWHVEGFESPLEAMRSLRDSLMDFNKEALWACCEKNSMEAGACFCKTCGREIGRLFDAQEELAQKASETLERMFAMTCDSVMGSGLGQHLEEDGWQTYGDDQLQAVSVTNVDRWIVEGEDSFMSWFANHVEGSTYDKD